MTPSWEPREHVLRIERGAWEWGQGLTTKEKGLNDQDNHDGMVSYLEPDILECEVKWVLGSITMSKASGGNGIPVELCQILEDDAVKVL